MPTADLFGYTPPLKTWDQEYKEHLSSKYWRELSKRAFARAGDRCEKCGFDKYSAKLTVHHLTYERLGHELLEDVIVVCAKNCHKIEDKKREKRTEEKNYEKLQDARFYGWASKVYGENWMVCNDEHIIYEEFQAWLETLYD